MSTQAKKIQKNLGNFTLYGKSVSIGDARWELPDDRPGSGSVAVIQWDFEVGDGKFTDAEHNSLLEELALFQISRVLDARGRDTPAPSTIATSSYGMRTLVRWMYSRGLASIGEITNELSWDYAQYSVATATAMRSARKTRDSEQSSLTTDDSPASASYNTAEKMLTVLAHLRLQADAMHQLGTAVLKEPPFDGRTVYQVLTEDEGLTRDGKLNPIPDDVGIPTINAAIRLIGLAADDVMKLQALHESVRYLPPGPLRNERYAENREKIRNFEFSTIEGEKDPWREPIDLSERTYRDSRTFEIKETQAVRRLVIAVQTACAIAIQSLTGMRAHELIGVKVEEELIDGLPSCIDVELTRDGTMRKYLLKSKVFKGRKREERWLIGTSFIGSNELPVPVRAIKTLFELNKPWRELSGLKSLFLQFSNGQGLPRVKESISEIRTQLMSDRQKDFLNEFVDLSQASESSQRLYKNGETLRPHQWRPTFAMFVVRVNPKLLPALSEHYKHMNSAITERGYIGNDPSFMYTMDGARSQRSAETLLALTSPGSALIGGGAKKFKEDSERLREMIHEMPGLTLDEKAISFVEENQLYIYDAAHGYCLSAFAPSKSRCRQLGGYAGPLRPYPNDIFRSVPTCTMCQLLIISSDHRPYHLRRVEENQAIIDKQDGELHPGLVRTLVQRVNQSKQMVKLMDRGSEA